MLALACLLQKILGIQGEFLEKMMMMLIYQGVPIKNRGMMIPLCGFRMAEGTTPGFVTRYKVLQWCFTYQTKPT
jgi:hypothetical protein